MVFPDDRSSIKKQANLFEIEKKTTVASFTKIHMEDLFFFFFSFHKLGRELPNFKRSIKNHPLCALFTAPCACITITSDDDHFFQNLLHHASCDSSMWEKIISNHVIESESHLAYTIHDYRGVQSFVL